MRGDDAPALGHATFSQADLLEELREMVRDAMSVHFDDDERPRLARVRFAGPR